MQVEIIVPVVLFLSTAVILGLLLMFRHRNQREVQRTLRAAIERGQDTSPEALMQLTAALRPPDADLRRGTISLAIGVGLAIFAFLQGEEEAVAPLLGISAFPFLIGAAYLALWKLRGPRT